MNLSHCRILPQEEKAMRTIRAILKKKRGQAIVEFALILPVFILILLGIMEFGLVFHQYLVVTAASRDGARVAALGGTDAETLTMVNTSAASINSGQLTTTITPANRVKGQTVSVQVTNPVTIRAPLIAQVFPQNPFPVTVTTIMRVE